MPKKFIEPRKLNCLVLIFTFLTLFAPFVFSQTKELFPDLSDQDIDAAADQMEFIGGNIIGGGNVVVKYKDIMLRCDRIIINVDSKDAEATGNVVFTRRVESLHELERWEFDELQKDTSKKLITKGFVNKASGRKVLLVNVITETAVWRGERAIGNLATGIFDLGKFEGKVDNIFFTGEKAEREPGGIIQVDDAKLTTCEFLLEGHEHYSITASRVRFIPAQEQVKDIRDRAARDIGMYHVWAYNCTFWIGNVPIFWSPVLYKAPDISGFGWQTQFGHDSDWGYYVKTKKTVQPSDDPLIHASILADYFTKRGPGAGLEVKMHTEKSYTEALIYGMLDRDPESTAHARFTIPRERYDAYLESYWHITPRLDFRGRIESISDINFLHDFFDERYYRDPQPATYASMDYQFDRFIVSGTVRPRINDFFTEVERLPEFRLDIPRQELFHNIYYQGETSIANLRMRWRDFDIKRRAGNRIDPEDYDSTRFDTLHMLYYPFNLDWLNLIPRSGLRLTYYSDTSKRRISPSDLNTMLGADNFGRGEPCGSVVNYDAEGNEKWRFIYEGGFEANTKISRAWTDVKNAFWNIDGIRHVIVPYINYNFIPEPSVNRDNLYYFDDLDRLNRQNFVRMGVKNRLQTRRGDWDNQSIYTWATMENYVDYHFVREKKIDGSKFPHFGDFGTKLEFTPIPDFSLTSDLLIDPANLKINKYSASLRYDITHEWKLFSNYTFTNEYDQRSVYSMGSSLTDISSGTSFLRRYHKNHDVSFGIEFPIRETTRGVFEVSYNFEAKLINESRVKLIQNLHCWEMALEYRLRQRKSAAGEKENKHGMMLMFYLTAAPDVRIYARQSRDTGRTITP